MEKTVDELKSSTAIQDPSASQDPLISEAVVKSRSLLKTYHNHKRGAIHMHRTLDQFYYDSIPTETRDKTQVLYRFSARHIESTVNTGSVQNKPEPLPRIPSYSRNPVIFTVDQLWIWIIDESKSLECYPVVL